MRICVQNDDGKGRQHALDMPTLRDPKGKEKPDRLTIEDGWVDAELKKYGGQAWIIVTNLELGLMVGGWRVQSVEKDRVYVQILEGDWRDITEKEFRDWEKPDAAKA